MTVADRVRERKICEAVVRVLETLTATIRCGGCSPEALPAQYLDSERVEWVAAIGPKKFAIEVTQVQPLPNRIRQTEQLERLFEPIVAELNGKLPSPGIYEACIAPGALSGRPLSEGVRRETLTEWIRSVAPKLGMKPPNHFARETPAGVGFQVTLFRFPTRRHDGCLRVAYTRPENLAAEQRFPIRKALKKKLPKLLRWQAKGAEAVLSVETRDIALSDEHLVAEILIEELRSRVPALDYVFIIDTATTQWPVYKVNAPGRLDEIANFDEPGLVPLW